MSNADGTNNDGHGHVFERPDGRRTRCGGPIICADCALDEARRMMKLETAQRRKLASLCETVMQCVKILDDGSDANRDEDVGEVRRKLRAAVLAAT